MQAEPVPTKDAYHRDVADSAVPEWRGVIEQRLDALRSEFFGVGALPRRKVSELGREIQCLAMIAAWFEAGGNITRVAERLGTSRRAVRERVGEWRQRYPHLAPSTVLVPLLRHKSLMRSEPRRRKGKQQTQQTQESGQGDEASIP